MVYNCNSAGGDAADDVPSASTLPNSQSDNPPAEDSRRVLLSALKSNSSKLKLKSCGGLLVAVAAGAAVGALGTVFTLRPALRQNGIQQQEMQAASPRSSKAGKDGSEYCGNPEEECGMTIPAGETFNLEKDLVCTTATAGGGDDAVAITVEEGATLNCGGHSVVQLNDEVGKAVGCSSPSKPVSTCNMAWGRVGVELKSGAKVENCRVSGWLDGLSIKPPSDKIEINNCGVTLNRNGLYVVGEENDVVDYSIENRYVYSYSYFCMI